MLKNVKDIISNRVILRKTLFTLLIFLVYRFGCILTVPGVNKQMLKISTYSIFSLMNLFGGGSLANFSIFALGIGPFITSGIVIELLSDVIPILHEWKHEGNKGRKKMERTGRFLGVVLAVVQASSITYAFNHQYWIMDNPDLMSYLFVITMLTGGALAVSWLADQITLHGIGNGMSLLIFAGIVSELPGTFISNFNATVINAVGTEHLLQGIAHFAGFTVLYLLLILGVILIETAEKRLTIMCTKKLSNGSTATYMPIRLNSSGVLPVIFAQTIMTVPQNLISFFSIDLYSKANGLLSLGTGTGLAIYGLLTFVLTFFYTSVVLDKEEISENFKKQGFFIPNIRIGRDTEHQLSVTINRTTLIGAFSLTVIACLPYILSHFASVTDTAALGGTGIIVAVGVAMEMLKHMDTVQKENRYEKVHLF